MNQKFSREQKLDQQPRETSKSTAYVYIIGLASAIVLLSIWRYNWLLFDDSIESISEAGQFGDRFGFSTSLFGALTIVGLIITILLQREEIRNGKEEFKEQNRTLKYQRFDNTFFNMLMLHNEIVNGLPGGRGKFLNILKKIYNQHSSFKAANTMPSLRAEYHRGDNESISTHVEDELGQYINNFELVIDIIYDIKKKKDSQEKYLKIFFAQMTNVEKILLIYHLNFGFRKRSIHWNEFKFLLFGSLNDSNQIWSEHLRLLDGTKETLPNSPTK
jgi:hypothetical protein